MKANELRIGNIINAYGYDVFVKKIENDSVSFDCNSDQGRPVYDDIFIEDANHVPLTEEWLVKLGLNRYAKDNWGNFRYKFSDDRYEIRKQHNDTELQVLFEGNGLVWVKYVHQLQNLYFALTGEELTSKNG